MGGEELRQKDEEAVNYVIEAGEHGPQGGARCSVPAWGDLRMRGLRLGDTKSQSERLRGLRLHSSLVQVEIQDIFPENTHLHTCIPLSTHMIISSHSCNLFFAVRATVTLTHIFPIVYWSEPRKCSDVALGPKVCISTDFKEMEESGYQETMLGKMERRRQVSLAGGLMKALSENWMPKVHINLTKYLSICCYTFKN